MAESLQNEQKSDIKDLSSKFGLSKQEQRTLVAVCERANSNKLRQVEGEEDDLSRWSH